jgi:serine/threonine-protein kinase
MRRSFLKTATLCAALFCAGSALADSFGAIAYSPSTGATGWSYDHGSRRDAERTARNNCDQSANDCRTAIWFKNGCGALAVGQGGGWGADWGADIDPAKYLAVEACRQNASGCKVIRWQCSGLR